MFHIQITIKMKLTPTSMETISSCSWGNCSQKPELAFLLWVSDTCRMQFFPQYFIPNTAQSTKISIQRRFTTLTFLLLHSFYCGCVVFLLVIVRTLIT